MLHTFDTEGSFSERFEGVEVHYSCCGFHMDLLFYYYFFKMNIQSAIGFKLCFCIAKWSRQ